MSGIEIEAKCEGKTTSIKCIRPKWEDIFRGYPKRKKNEEDEKYGDKEYKDEDPYKVLGFLFYDRPGGIGDACAARLSIALLNAGINIDINGDKNIKEFRSTIEEEKEIKGKKVVSTETIVLEKITKGDISDGENLETRPINNLNGKNVILTAEKMRHWLWKKWGKADYIVYFPKELEDLQKQFKGKKGVYIMRPNYPATTSEKTGFNASGHCTLWTGEDVIGKHYADVAGGTFAAYLWELK